MAMHSLHGGITMGKSSINGGISIVMFDHGRVHERGQCIFQILRFCSKKPFKYTKHHQGYSRPPNHGMHLFLDLRFGNLKAKGLFAQTFKSWFQLVVKDCPCNTLHRMILDTLKVDLLPILIAVVIKVGNREPLRFS